MTGMVTGMVITLVDNRGDAYHIATTTPDSSHYTKGAPGTTPADVEPPSSRDAGRGGGMIAADVQGFLECVP